MAQRKRITPDDLDGNQLPVGKVQHGPQAEVADCSVHSWSGSYAMWSVTMVMNARSRWRRRISLW